MPPIPVVPADPLVLDESLVPDAPVVPLIPVALRALSAALGEVRTTVPVSLRGTACRLASAAAWGVVPTAVVGWFALIPGVVDVLGMVVVPGILVDWARAAALLAISAVASKILVVIDFFMMKVTPVGLEKIISFSSNVIAIVQKNSQLMWRRLCRCSHPRDVSEEARLM